MSDKNLIIGLGTGRSGSWSLTMFLNGQRDANVSHETSFCPWELYPRGMRGLVYSILQRDAKFVGDVGFYYLNYIDMILELEPNTKFVCLQRDKQATTKSWLRQSGQANHWTKLSSEHWHEDAMLTHNSFYFPKYDLPKKEAIEQYWEDYYEKAQMWEERYPNNFRIWNMNALNSKEGMNSILSFVGVPKQGRKFKRCHYNRKDHLFVTHERMPLRVGTCEFCRAADSAEWYVKEHKHGVISYACDNCKQNGDLGIFNKEEV